MNNNFRSMQTKLNTQYFYNRMVKALLANYKNKMHRKQIVFGHNY